MQSGEFSVILYHPDRHLFPVLVGGRMSWKLESHNQKYNCCIHTCRSKMEIIVIEYKPILSQNI